MCNTLYYNFASGVHGAEKETDTMYDIVFDKEFVGGVKLRCSEQRGYRMTCQGFINLTYGMKHDRTKSQSKPTAVVQPSGNLLMYYF